MVWTVSPFVVGRTVNTRPVSAECRTDGSNISEMTVLYPVADTQAAWQAGPLLAQFARRPLHPIHHLPNFSLLLFWRLRHGDVAALTVGRAGSCLQQEDTPWQNRY